MGRSITYYHTWALWYPDGIGGLLDRQVLRDASGNIVQTQTTDYISAGIERGSFMPSGYTTLDNSNPISTRSDRMPMRTSSSTITQDGDTYETTLSYNTSESSSSYSYGNPLTTVKDASFESHSRTTQQTYLNIKSNWLLSLPRRTTVEGVVVRENMYGSNTDTASNKGLLTSIKRFGQTMATMTHYTSTGYKGALFKITDGEGDWTELRNWHRGTATRLRWDDDGTQNAYQQVDDNGWMYRSRDARGNWTYYYYNDLGHMTQISPPGSFIDTNIAYNYGGGTGLMTQTVTRGTATTTIKHDGMFRPYEVKEQDGSFVSYVTSEFDPMSRTIYTSRPTSSPNSNAGPETVFDALDRPIRVKDRADTSVETLTAYLSSNRTRVTDPEGFQTTEWKSGFDGPGGGELERIQETLRNTYLDRNTRGRIDQLRQVGGGKTITQTMRYDAQDRLCAHYVPEHGQSRYLYNARGQVEYYIKGQSNSGSCKTSFGSLHDSGQQNGRVTLSYDSRGRLTTTNFADPGTPDVVRDYDADGNVTLVNRGTGGSAANWTYTYNELSLPLTEKLDIDGRNYDISYVYNANAHLTRRTMPTGRQLNYTPDGFGRIKTVKNGGATVASNIQYHSNAVVSSLTLGNGHIYSQTLTSLQQPLRVRSVKGSIKALDLTYSYNDRGLVTAISDAADSANSRSYGYDALGQLTSASGPWGAGSYNYDAVGNLLSKTLGSRTVSLLYDSRNRVYRSTDTGGSGMASTGTRTVAYDNRGNVTTLGALGFNYDYSDQPTAVSGSSNGTYRYDGNLKRVKAIVDSKTSYNVYDLSGALVHVDKRPGGGQSEDRTDYVSGPTGMLARITDNVVTYLHNDHLGSASAGTNSAGNKIWTERYTPYGEALLTPSANNDLAGYTGHMRDAATALNYMQARYQDPVIGRFLSVDPVTFYHTTFSSMVNRYQYVGNDPINSYDPTGMVERKVDRRVSTGQSGKLKKTVSITVEAGSLTQSETEDVLSGVSDQFFEAFDGKDLSKAAVKVGFVNQDGQFRSTGSDVDRTEFERSVVGLAHQIGLAMDPERFGPPTNSIAYSDVFAQHKYGAVLKGTKTYFMTAKSLNGGIAQAISTSIHERNHIRRGDQHPSTSTLDFSSHKRIRNRTAAKLKKYNMKAKIY